MAKKTKKKRPKTSGKLVRPRASRGATGLTTQDPLLQAYMKEVKSYPLLTREEERELAVKAFDRNDRDAIQKLVTSNLRFVVKIAFEYVNYRLKLLDLIQEGNMGLVKAVKEFNPYKDVRLTTYAVWWIRSYIQDAILKNYSLVKMGTTQAQKRLFYRLKAEQAKLAREGIGPEDQVKLLAANLDVKEKEVREMDQRMSSADLSLNAPLPHDESRKHMDRLTDPGESVDDSLGENEQLVLFKRVLKKFGDSLEGREKVVFEERMISEKPITLQEIGDRYGVSKERARQVEEQIKKKLKAFVQEQYPDYELLTESIG